MGIRLSDLFPIGGSRPAHVARRPGRPHGRARAAAKRSRAVLLEAIEPRILLSGDPLPGGSTAALSAGLTAVGAAIDQQFEDPLLQEHLVPGILVKGGTPEVPLEFSPNLAQATSVFVNVSPGAPLALSGTSLADRYNAVLGFAGGMTSLSSTNPVSLQFKESLFAAMDLDADGWVGLDEAFQVLGIGQIHDYLLNNPINDDFGDDDGDLEPEDLGLQVLKFLRGALGADEPAFGVPEKLAALWDFDVGLASTSIYNAVNGTLTWAIDLSMTMTAQQRLDLGYEADQLGVALGPGTPANPKGTPKTATVTSTLDLGSFVFGLREAEGSSFEADDFFFALPGGFSLGVEFATPTNFSAADLASAPINVGFLGASLLPGSFMALDMAVLGTATDPSDPAALGFTAVQGVTQADGTITANTVPSLELPATGIEFELKIGALGNPVAVTVPGGDYAGVASLAAAVQTAIDGALGSSLLVDVTVDGGGKLVLGLADPSANFTDALGLANGDAGMTTLTASAESTLLGALPPGGTVEFWLSIGGAVPVRVVVTVAGDPAGPDGEVDNDDTDAAVNADNGQVTIASLVGSVNAALLAAGLDAQVSAGAVPVGSEVRLRLSALGPDATLELPQSLTLSDIEQITLAELTGAADEIFDVAADPNARFELDLQLIAREGLTAVDADGTVVGAYQPTGRIYADAKPFSSDIKAALADGGARVKADFTLYDRDGTLGDREALRDGASDLQPMLDFNVISVGDILGIVGEIANYVDRLAASELLQAFDIPFAQKTLGELLDLKDLVTDSLLLDDGDDGNTKPGTAGIVDEARLLGWVPKPGDLTQFELRPKFSTAQDLGQRLIDLLLTLGVRSDIADPVVRLAAVSAIVTPRVRAYTENGQPRQDLQYGLSIKNSLTPGGEAVEVPLDFALDLAPLGSFVTDGKVALKADGEMGFTLGIKLGNAAKALDIVGATTDLLADINSGNGIKVNTNLALSSLGIIEPLVGRLSGTAVFTVKVFTGPTDFTEHTVTLAQSETLNNRTLANLVADLNAALAGATNGGLGGKIEAAALSQVVGTTVTERLVLRVADTAAGQGIDGFEIGVSTANVAYTELGLQSQRAATVSLVAPAPVGKANPGGDLSLRFNLHYADDSPSGEINIIVAGTALQDNVSLASLVADINAALQTNNATAGIVASQTGGRLAFSAVDANIRFFTVTPLTGDEPDVEQRVADVGLSTGGAPATLQAAIQLRGGGAIENPTGRLAADLKFNVNGTEVEVLADSTLSNASIGDLVADLNSALGTAGLAVRAQSEGLRIVFRATSGAVGAITLADVAGHTGAGLAAIGFADGASTRNVDGQPGLSIVAAQTAPLSYGVGVDSSFQVSVTGADGTRGGTVNLTREGTVLNRSAFDLAASINNALNTAFGGAGANPLVATIQAGQLVIGLKTSAVGGNLIGDPLALSGLGTVTGFSIANLTGAATTDLKLAAGAANHADLVIQFSNGDPVAIVLEAQGGGVGIAGIGTDSARRLTGDLATLVAGIVAQAGASRLDIQVGPDGSSLLLIDKTFVDGGPNAAVFGVSAINGSLAALQLGIAGTDTARLDPAGGAVLNAVADGRLEGGRIATVDLLDRVYLEDIGLSATVTVSTPEAASATANFGFVGVKLSTEDAQELFTATLNVPFLQAADGATLDTLFKSLGRVSSLTDFVGLPTLTTNSNFSLKVTVDGALEGFASALNVPALADIDISFTDLGMLEVKEKLVGGVDVGRIELKAPNVVVDFDAAGLGDLFAFKDLSFANVIDGLRALAGVLDTFANYDFLGQEIPGIGLSVDDLLSIADKFAAALDALERDPNGSLQTLAQKLREAFGLPNFASAAERDAFFANFGISDPTDLIGFAVDTVDSAQVLRLDLRLPVGFSRALPVDLDLGDLAALGPVQLKGGANLAASGYLDARLSLGIDLSDPTNLWVYDDASGIFGGLSASGDRLAFNAAIGPLGVFVRDGRFDLDLAFSAVNDDGDAAPMTLVDYIAGLDASLTGTATATLPVYFPTDSIYLGDVGLDISGTNALQLSGSGGLQLPDFAAPGVLTLPDFSGIDFSQLNVFDSIPLLLDALDFFLQGLQDILDGEVAGVEIPLIGDQLAGGVDFIESLRKDILGPIRAYVEQAPELGLEFVQALLYELLGAPSAQGTVDGVSIESILGIGSDIQGIGLLKGYFSGSTNLSQIDQDDIVAVWDEDANDFSWKFRLGQTYSPNIDFGFDIGIPALSLAADVGLDVDISWDLALGLGLNTSDGPYIFIGNHRTTGDTDDEELLVTIDVGLSENSNLRGSLGFLQLTISESDTADGLLDGKPKDDANDPTVYGTFAQVQFAIDLVNKNDATDEKLSFSELGSLGADVSLRAQAEVNLDIKAEFNRDILPDTLTALLPSVDARFILDWDTGNILGDDFNFASSLKDLGFRDVGIDMGSFLSDFLGPFVSKVAEITGPLQPIIDVITAPIPVISDLAGRPISLVDLAGLTGYVEPGLIYAIADIISLVNRIGEASTIGELRLPVGDFILITDGQGINTGDPSKPFNPEALLGAGFSFDAGGFDAKTLETQFASLAGNLSDALASAPASTDESKKTQEITSSLTGPDASLSGFSFPLFDKPSLIFGLLLGQDIPLVTYDLAPFGMDFTYVQKFPIWGPLFARIGGSVGMTIDLAFGYDTAGVRSFAAGDFSNPLDLLGGFYVSDTNLPEGTGGVDVPELILRGELFAGAEINLGIGSAGVEGAIGLVVNFDLYDPDRDGRVRVNELVGNFLYEFNYGSPALAPIAIFDVTGEIYAQLRAFIELLFFEETFNITPPITLFEFAIPFERQPFLATERGDGSLLLNIGPNAAQRLNGDTRDIGEQIYVKSVDGSSNEVLVWGMGIQSGDAQRYRLGADKTIVAYGGAGNDVIDLRGVSATSGIRYLVEGGDGDDEIWGTQAGGRMDGGRGNDKLHGGAGVDLIVGGEGNDLIRGYGGADILFGDTGSVSRTTLSADEGSEQVDRFRVIVGDKDGDDDIDGGDGNDIIFGGGGRDLIRGGGGADLIFGDGGSFDMGPGNQLRKLANGRVDLAQFNARGAGAADTIYGDAGDDVILGGAGDDRIDGGAGDDVIDGGIGFDVIYGGSGADWLFGGDNDDIIFGYRDPSGAVFGFAGDTADLGGAADATAAALADGGDFIDGGEGNDYLRGQGGDDTIHGGRGNDIIFGDTGVDRLFGGDGSDILFGGADGDFIDGGAGGDIVFGDDGLVVYYGYSAPPLAPFLDTGSRIRVGADGTRYIGDDDVALAAAYAGLADSIATSMDLVVTQTRASDGNDTISGGDGNDIVFGGGGNDIVFGDYDPAAGFSGPRPFGQDILVGDGGRVEMHGRRNAAAMAEAGDHDGNDTIQGNDGSDYLFGGGGADTIYGFQQAGGSSLAGVPDNDIIVGDNGVMRFDTTDRLNRVKSVETTSTGGAGDFLYGQQGNDIVFGGLGIDLIEGNDGDDILVGDHGEVRFDLTDDLDVLDLVRSFADGLGDGDLIFGNAGNDIVIGGTGGDILRGNDGDDILLGDNGRIDLRAGPGRLLVQVAAMPSASAVLSITTTDTAEATGGEDIIAGDAGADILFGGVAGDSLFGDSASPVAGLDGADVIVGDNGRLLFDGLDLFTLVLLESFTDGLGGDDTIRGNAGGDVAIGGTGADTLLGDDATGSSDALDGADILVGDNARLVLRKVKDGETPQLSVLGAGVSSIRTTDSATLPYWQASFNDDWIDTISGQAGGDVIIGGLAGDFLYGAALAPVYALDGADIILGDNGELDFDVDGDLGVLNLVRSNRDNLGGNDEIHGHSAGDVAIGGTGADLIYGDNDAAAGGAADGDDILLGDNADIVLRKPGAGEQAQIVVRGGGVRWITTTDEIDDKSWVDIISGNAGRDIIVGGLAGDFLYGDRALPTASSIALDRGDILLGDNGRLDFDLNGNLGSLDRIETFLDALGGDDFIAGHAGADVAFGGTGNDTIHGDDATASAGASDGNDILVGDNGVVELVTAPLAAPTAQGIRIYGGAVAAIFSTDDDSNHENTAGSDFIEGNAGADIIIGGSKGDRLYGDRAVITEASNAIDGADIILGDNGRLEWLSAGRLGDITGIDLAATNADLWAHFQAGADGNVDTLDLITTEQPNNGGRDLIIGGNGGDVIFGGTDSDLVFGDTAGALAPNANGNDLIFGDHGRLYPQFSRALVGKDLVELVGIHGRNFFAIDTAAGDGGDGDILFGEEGDDILLGQQGDDRMFGGTGDDDMIGGHNVAGGWDELAGSGFGAVSVAGTWDIALVGVDLTRGGAWNDVMDGGSGNDAMAGDNATVWRRGDTLNARFRAVDGSVLYSTTYDSVTVNVQGQGDLADSAFWRPELGTTVGRDIALLDHSDAVQADPQGRYGNDVMAGGADNDTMFGQLGDDLMQGDGDLTWAPNASKGLFSFTDTGVVPAYWPVATLAAVEALHFNVPERLATDGADYLEGNGGNDILYGGLGQDDMIGGSSELYGLTTRTMRPDGADIMFGGAGNPDRMARNAGFNTATQTDGDGLNRADDADFMLGDNGNIFRIVNPAGTAYARWTYDTAAYSSGLVVRGMQWLDYTLGGPDYDPASQGLDRGAGDWLHGESGNDTLHGMAGSDVLFGGAHDDDLIGGYGHDWISGGTGQDGVIGDDGLILTSRNGTAEPLIGLTSPNQQQFIKTPGSMQTATIYPTGQLLKAVDLTPISVDPLWNAQDDEFGYGAAQGGIPYADDIIYGGLGSDFLHGGSGDDAISGAEALPFFYSAALVTMPGTTISGLPAELGAIGGVALGEDTLSSVGGIIGAGLWVNPGNVLRFNPVDEVAWKTQNRQRAGEFALYDEYNPLRMIRVTSVDGWSGELTWISGGAFDPTAGHDFILNFDPTEGVLRPGYEITVNGNKKVQVPAVHDDGDDVIFGGTGNDWLVGGTGKDTLYGGWGNDLLNVDDDHRTRGGLNDEPDTHATYEDRAYGGAGRDVLIANTGGDRLIDWVGEYNSYLVPFAPFGMATVSRTLQPQLPEFLYALSRAQGADATIVADGNGSAIRNGEPYGELGVVLQKDFAWRDQTGAPADPQAGNIPGGKRDVLRSADFNDGQTQGFVPESGNWSIVQGKYQVAPSGGSNRDAISLFYVDDFVPSYFEIQATLNAVKPTGGLKANAYVIFDYHSATDFKFAGINVSTNKFEIGQRTGAGWQVLATGVVNGSLRADRDYNLLLALNGTTVTMVVDNAQSLTHSFAPRVMPDGLTLNLNAGMVGLGADNGRARIDNVRVQMLPPEITYSALDEFDGGASLLQAVLGSWTVAGGRMVANPAGAVPAAISANDIAVGTYATLRLESVFSTGARAGMVFDMYSDTDFKWAAVDHTSGQVLIGHYTKAGGWAVDASAARTLPVGDLKLTVTLKGTTVGVAINGQAALTYTFNAPVVDGEVGLLALGGAASFDSFLLQTDDPRLGGEAPTMGISTLNTAGGGGSDTLFIATTSTLQAAATGGDADSGSATLQPVLTALMAAEPTAVADSDAALPPREIARVLFARDDALRGAAMAADDPAVPEVFTRPTAGHTVAMAEPVIRWAPSDAGTVTDWDAWLEEDFAAFDAGPRLWQESFVTQTGRAAPDPARNLRVVL